MQDILAEHVANAHRQAESSPLVAVQAARKAVDAISHDAFLRKAGRGVPPDAESIVQALTVKGACSQDVARAFETIFRAETDAHRSAPRPDALAAMLAALRVVATWYWGEVLKAEPPANVNLFLKPNQSIAADDDDEGGTLVMRSKGPPKRVIADDEKGRTEVAMQKVARPAAPPRPVMPAYVPPLAPAPAPEPEQSRLPLFFGVAAGVLLLVLVAVLVVL